MSCDYCDSFGIPLDSIEVLEAAWAEILEEIHRDRREVSRLSQLLDKDIQAARVKGLETVLGHVRAWVSELDDEGLGMVLVPPEGPDGVYRTRRDAVLTSIDNILKFTP